MADDDESQPRVTLLKTADEPLYRGVVRGKHEVYVDEGTTPPPVGSGEDRYPTPVDNMCWALAACQAAVLTQCLAKARIDDFSIEVSVDIDREQVEGVAEEMPVHTGRRIREFDVSVNLDVAEEFESRAQRCLDVYDQGCIVGQSFKAGIDYDPETTFGTY